MPVYEYECLSCGKRHEVMQKFSDLVLTECPVCKGKLKKLISNTSFVLKGSGWYVTDYARKDGDGNGKKEKKPAAKEESKSETAADTKSPSKEESKSETASKSEENKSPQE